MHNGPPGDLLLEVASLFDQLVEDVDNAVGQLDDWGYAERPIRGGVELSNHASGTAVDLNATRHVLGADPAASFSPAQIACIHSILAATVVNGFQVVRWGGDYDGRKDSMHFELNDGSTPEQCDAALGQVRAFRAPAPPAPAPSGRPTLQKGDRGQAVVDLQRRLTTGYPAYNKYPCTGLFGDLTDAGVREFQRRSGLTADGVVGPRTWAALGM